MAVFADLSKWRAQHEYDGHSDHWEISVQLSISLRAASANHVTKAVWFDSGSLERA